MVFQLKFERQTSTTGSNDQIDAIGLASDDVTKHSNVWQRWKLVLNKDSVPYKSMLGEKSVIRRSSLFFRGEVWKVLTALSQLRASHVRDIGDRTSAGLFFSGSTVSQLCMERYLCLDPILPVATPVAALWRSTWKRYTNVYFGSARWRKLRA